MDDDWGLAARKQDDEWKKKEVSNFWCMMHILNADAADVMSVIWKTFERHSV